MGVLLQFPDDEERSRRAPQFKRSAAPRKVGEPTLCELAKSWNVYLDDVVSPKTTKLYLGAVQELEAS
ncbi:MAG: hypothetical protein ACR2KQ_06285 [Actinomycetota bacterium]